MSYDGTWSDPLTASQKAKMREFFEQAQREDRWTQEEVMQPIRRIKDGHTYAIKGARP